MLVPRSFKYSSAPVATDRSGERRRTRPTTRRGIPHHLQTRAPSVLRRPGSPARTNTEPVVIPSPQTSTNDSSLEATSSGSTPQTMPFFKSATVDGRRRKPSSHDPNALPPAVAALLAVTAIPPRQPNRYRSRPGSDRRISVEDLVKGWKSDELLKSSYGSPGLEVLLEDLDDCMFEDGQHEDNGTPPAYLNTRSASSESMPSLEADDRSMLSLGSPSTPESLRSRKSYQNLKKDKSRSLPTVEDCVSDHPLIPHRDTDQDDLVLMHKKPLSATKGRSSFTSNLTTSLQSLKKAAVNSISSLGRASSSPALSRQSAAPIDDMLWSHPFLFPRFSSEVRPATDSWPTTAERRYLNPMPLTFEEQEAPFQQALHAPFLAQPIQDAPTIQMQTYNRGQKRKASRRAPSPNSEAGRALLGADGVRQREVRENPDFLRVVVLEMNMRREGKLEHGRAKIWLPPRQSSAVGAAGARVPKRWVGVSAY